MAFASSAHAQERGRRGRGLWGDWIVEMPVGDRKIETILSFSRSPRDSSGNSSDDSRATETSERRWTGQWVSFWAATDLEDVKFEGGKLSFKYSRRSRSGETRTSTFDGRIEDGKLTGTLSSGGEDRSITGSRERRLPRAVGTWDIRFKIGEREIENSLVVSQKGDDGKLAAQWKSSRVEHKIEDVSYERGKLAFRVDSKMDEREWSSKFDGSIEGDALKATVKSDNGELSVEGQRRGAAAIGVWNLDVDSRRGQYKQRLRIYRDLSARFGVAKVEDFAIDGQKLTCKIVREFGERRFEMTFEGTMKEGKLEGEIKTSRGTTKVAGKKVERRSPRRRREAAESK